MHDLFLFAFGHEGIYYFLLFLLFLFAVSYLYFGWFLIRLEGSLAGFLFAFFAQIHWGGFLCKVFIV